MDGENEQNRCLTANVIAAINKRPRRPCQKTATTDNDDVQTDLDVDQSRIDFSAENPPLTTDGDVVQKTVYKNAANKQSVDNKPKDTSDKNSMIMSTGH